MKRYLVVGNGVAGTTAAEHIRRQDKDGPITIVTNEAFPFYYRVRLPEYISGDLTEESLLAKKDKWYKEQGIELRLNTRVVEADPGAKALLTANSEKLPYDRLLMATGSRSFVPPVKGSNKKGVFALRSIQDAREISAWGKDVQDVVLIGGGLLGLEAGNALRKLGKEVVVVEFFPRLLPRQLDVDGARRLQKVMEEMGFSFRLAQRPRR